MGDSSNRRRQSFYETLTAAINDFAEHGYDTQARLDRWTDAIRRAAEADAVPLDVLERELRGTLRAIYTRLVTNGEMLRQHPGVARFTLAKVRPKLRAELDRRILASAELIRLNREEAINTTLRRFSGWATSIPKGGSEAVERRETKADVRKALASLPFEERRVAVDQGHKFVASLNNILAVDAGAIAGVWHSHWRQRGYDYREDHKERDGEYYAVRGSWADEKGFVNRGAGYTDEITMPGQEVYCRCFYRYVYALSKLPANMLTAKGRAALDGLKVAA